MPAALAFHPAIGVVAATVFQLVPFVLLSLMARTRPDVAILACALVEPVFRLAPGGGLDPRNALMAAILIAFGLFEMRTRARDSFTAGFALRMGY